MILPTGVSLSASTASIWSWVEYQLEAYIVPELASNNKIHWSASNNNVTVDENGLVTWVTDGTSVVTATTDYGGYTASCTFTVFTIPVTWVSLDVNELKLAPWKTYQLTATITPNDATNKKVTWRSTNTSVAVVDNNGLVTCIDKGDAEIIVTTADWWYTDSCGIVWWRAPGENTIVYLPLEWDLSRYWRYSTWAVNIWSDTPYEDIFWNIQWIRFKWNNNSYIQITDVPAMDTDFTLNFWALLYSNTWWMFVERWTSNNTNCRLHYVIRNTTKVDLWFYANDCPGTTNTVNWVWYNFTATYNHTTREQKVYINWALDGSRIWSWDPAFWSWALNLWWAHSFTTWDNANCTMSRFIWEDKIWSETDINDYIDLTISDYQDKRENYEEVEYIQSSWTWTNTWPYINTWIQLQSWKVMKIEWEFYTLEDTTNEREVFATYGWWVNLQTWWGSNMLTTWWSSITYNPSNRANNTLYHVEWTFNWWNSIRSVYLFWQNEWDNWYARHNCSIRLYYFKIRENDVLVRDFIPCYRKSDNKPWLFDMVNNTFYMNSWTWSWDFTIPPQ